MTVVCPGAAVVIQYLSGYGIVIAKGGDPEPGIIGKARGHAQWKGIRYGLGDIRCGQYGLLPQRGDVAPNLIQHGLLFGRRELVAGLLPILAASDRRWGGFIRDDGVGWPYQQSGGAEHREEKRKRTIHKRYVSIERELFTTRTVHSIKKVLDLFTDHL
jgi:hypothetical protein